MPLGIWSRWDETVPGLHPGLHFPCVSLNWIIQPALDRPAIFYYHSNFLSRQKNFQVRLWLLHKWQNTVLHIFSPLSFNDFFKKTLFIKKCAISITCLFLKKQSICWCWILCSTLWATEGRGKGFFNVREWLREISGDQWWRRRREGWSRRREEKEATFWIPWPQGNQ